MQSLLRVTILLCCADVAYASLDYKVSVQYADTPYGYNLYNLDLIQAPCNWNQETIGSQDIAVCIIDSGIQTNHPDLAANVWVNNAEIPNNGIDDDGNGMSSVYDVDPTVGSMLFACVSNGAACCILDHHLQPDAHMQVHCRPSRPILGMVP